jgi:PKD repeat protein
MRHLLTRAFVLTASVVLGVSVATAQVDVIQDGSFEAGNPNPFWTQFTTFIDPITSSGVCGSASGGWWVEMRQDPALPADYSVSQSVLLPAGGAATLEFQLQRMFPLGARRQLTELRVMVDSDVVLAQGTDTHPYEPRFIDVSAYADGAAHTVAFTATIDPTCVDCTFCVDDVTLMAPAAIPQADRDALIAVYNGTGGSSWSDSTGWLGPIGTECDWFGVTCNPARTQVVELALPANNLTGGVPSEVGSLVSLVTLDLSDNLLSGEIPVSLMALVNLTDNGGLDICNNQLYTDNTALRDFLNQKTLGGDWESCQIPTVRFDWTPPTPDAGQTVQFNDNTTSSPTTWSWTFGDGATSTLQHPTHVYGPGGTYTVSLTASNSVGSDSASEQISVAHVVPTAAFTWDPTAPDVGQQVQFTDTSSGYPTTWSWNFDDGSSSTEQNPTHSFGQAGTYDVALTVTNPAGSDLVTHQVTVGSAPVAAFGWTPTVPGVGEEVQFDDQSTNDPTSWAWDFGDGGTSTEQHPAHVFTSAGSYDVMLTATNGVGSDSVTRRIAVGDDPAADFTWSPTVPGVGESVQLTDLSLNNPDTWSWDFGDGATSSEQNPSHAWSATGTYDITLTVSNAAGSDSVTRQITVADDPVADFTWSPQAPAVGDTVQFTDTSRGSPDSWSWDFGDGATSSAQNPSHAYTAVGSYEVSLTVSNAAGTDTVVRSLIAGRTPVAAFSWSPVAPGAGEAVQFLDQSGNDPTSWSWDFGDGGSSAEQSPSHTYTEAGAYTVTLSVSNAAGSDSLSQQIAVGVPPSAAFTWHPAAPVAAEPVQFTDTSVGGPVAWQWSFGDGLSSSEQNPVHTYAQAGSMTVSLGVSNDFGSDTATAQVEVGDESAPPPVEGRAEQTVTAPGVEVAERLGVAVDRSGRRVVVWEQGRRAKELAAAAPQGEDGVFGRFYDPRDEPQGEPFALDAGTVTVGSPAVGFAGDGDLTVTFAGADGRIFARLLDAQGTPLTGSFAVDGGGGTAVAPRVAVAGSGDFVVAWRQAAGKQGEDGVFARFYDPSGEAKDEPLVVGAGEIAAGPQVATDASGNAVVVWSQGAAGKQGEDGVFARFFDPSGTPEGAAQQVSSATAGQVDDPTVASDTFGNSVVVWAERAAGKQSDGWDILARRYGGDEPAAGPFQVNQTSVGDQTSPAVAVNPDGDFVVAWQSGEVLMARLFDADGRAVGGEFEAAATEDGLAPTAPEVGVAGDDTVSVAFTRAAADGTGVGAYLRAFEVDRQPSACEPDQTTHCLNQERFEVRVIWRDFSDRTGIGQAVPLTDDSGTFWFFDQANVELILKVLDGTGINGHYWVFYGALSNVEYTVVVSDSVTGSSVTYSNPTGTFASVGDTSALPGDEKAPPVERFVEVPESQWLGRVTASTVLPEECVPSDTVLCLNDSRFQVEVSWRDFEDRTGVGRTLPLTSDTGSFWFFDGENIELVLKVLDGGAINGHFWVFYGALSNVEYTITVTDTDTGAVRTYFNPLEAFGSVGDIEAFPAP